MEPPLKSKTPKYFSGYDPEFAYSSSLNLQ